MDIWPIKFADIDVLEDLSGVHSRVRPQVLLLRHTNPGRTVRDAARIESINAVTKPIESANPTIVWPLSSGYLVDKVPVREGDRDEKQTRVRLHE